jgi:carbon monoxide dehydrogenase subunit G
MRTCWTGEFACKPERLWKFIEEPELQKQWMKGLQDNQRTSDGPPGVGSTFRMKIKEGSKVADYDGKISAYDPPRHLAVDLSGGNFPAGMVCHVAYELTDLQGRTRLDYETEIKCQGKMPLWMRLLMPIFKIFGAMQLKSFMRALKKLVEQPE